MACLLLGSISTVVDTSELQREAFNEAFARHDLGWTWDREDYQKMLTSNGGAERIAQHARERGQDVVAPAVHAAKSEIFQQLLRERGAEPRPGVVEAIRDAREQGMSVALVTTTSAANLAALGAALGDTLPFDEVFDLVTDADDVSTPKPAGDVYRYALSTLGESTDTALAVEDNPGGVVAATAAGLPCVAFPNENTRGLDFPGAAGHLDALSLTGLRDLTGR